MTQTSSAIVGHTTPGIELRRAPIPANGQVRTGKWLVVLLAAREAATQDECVAFDATDQIYKTAAATLYGHRKLLPGEKIHLHFDREAGVASVWITRVDS